MNKLLKEIVKLVNQYINSLHNIQQMVNIFITDILITVVAAVIVAVPVVAVIALVMRRRERQRSR